MEKIRLGIIGIGNQGSGYSKLIIDESKVGNIEVVAACDIDEEKLKEYGKKYSSVLIYTDWKELILSKKVDAIVTTVPHYLHTEIAIFALDNKVHVLDEKPAGIDAKSVRLMNEAADRNPEITFAIMFNQRTNGLYRKIKEIVDSKELGQLRRFNWIINSWWRTDGYYKSNDWRATWGGEGGGVLVNQAPHQLDLWQWITGMPKRVITKMKMGAHRDIAVDNDVTVICEYENGATGVFITSTFEPIGTDRLELGFSKGKIVVENSDKAIVYKMHKDESELNNTLSIGEMFSIVGSGRGSNSNEIFSSYEIVNTDDTSQHGKVFENFANCILGKEELLANGREGINEVNLVNGIYLSAFLNKEVELPINEDLFLEELNKKIKEEGIYKEREI